ncbi:MAG: hypothetical protein R3A48_25255 [Polyangiales bacterium]
MHSLASRVRPVCVVVSTSRCGSTITARSTAPRMASPSCSIMRESVARGGASAAGRPSISTMRGGWAARRRRWRTAR